MANYNDPFEALFALQRASFTQGTPRGLFGSIGLMAVHSWSVSS
jgi:hypothetical protein